jgi:stress response protein SCP2
MVLTLDKNMDPADLRGVENLSVGIAWDMIGGGGGRVMGALKRRKGVDLDLIAVAYNSSMEPVRYAGFDNLDPFSDGTLLHTGDNMSGKGDGDDELIDVNLMLVPGIVHKIVFVVAAFKRGSKFEDAGNISVSVYDGTGGTTEKVAMIWPSLIGNGNAIKVCTVERAGASWTLKVNETRGPVTQADVRNLYTFASR